MKTASTRLPTSAAFRGSSGSSRRRPVPGHATHLVKFTPLACGRLREGMTDIRDNAWKIIFKEENGGRVPGMDFNP